MDRAALSRRAFVAGLSAIPALVLAACGAPASTPANTPSAPTGATTGPSPTVAAAGTGTGAAPTAGAAPTTPPAPTTPATPTAAPAANPAPAPTPAPIKGSAGANATEIDVWANWGDPGFATAMRGVIDNFVKQNPDVAVNLVPGVDPSTKFLPAAAAGNPPDVISLWATAQYAVRNAIRPLDDWIKASKVVRRDQYSDVQWGFLMWKGQTYGVPAWDQSPYLALVWDKKLFQDGGLDPEKPPTTLQQLTDDANQLTKVDANGNLRQLGFDPLDAMGGSYYIFTWTGIFGVSWFDPGAQKLNLTGPGMVETVDYTTSFYRKVGAQKIAGFRQSYGTWTDPNSSIPQGVQAMQIDGGWNPGTLKTTAKPGLTFGYTWVPTKDGKKMQETASWAACIPQRAPNPEKGFRFGEYLTTVPAAQIIYDDVGFLSGSKDFRAQGKITDPNVKWYLDSLDQAQEQVPVYNLTIFNELSARLKAGHDAVARGQSSSKDMLAQLQADMQKALDDSLQG